MAEHAVTVPSVKEILTTGLQFGHSTSRWNPKMRKYLYTNKGGVHIFDVVQSAEALEKAVVELKKLAATGTVLFVGSKRQAVGLVRDEAVRAGAHFIVNRWPGGLLTNWDVIQKGIKRLHQLEKFFQEGVEGRTKYEVAQMKVEWTRLNRLYGGVKQMTEMPKAVVIVDPRYERVAVKETRRVMVPIFALTDSNCDPDQVDYVIPGNDDAIRSIELVIKTLADAVLAGNEGKGIVHDLQDYSQMDVKIIKVQHDGMGMDAEAVVETPAAAPTEAERSAEMKKPSKAPTKAAKGGKGLLEIARERSEGSDTKSKGKK